MIFLCAAFHGTGCSPIKDCISLPATPRVLAERRWSNGHDWNETQMSGGECVWRTCICDRNSSGKEIKRKNSRRSLLDLKKKKKKMQNAYCLLEPSFNRSSDILPAKLSPSSPTLTILYPLIPLRRRAVVGAWQPSSPQNCWKPYFQQAPLKSHTAYCKGVTGWPQPLSSPVWDITGPCFSEAMQKTLSFICWPCTTMTVMTGRRMN